MDYNNKYIKYKNKYYTLLKSYLQPNQKVLYKNKDYVTILKVHYDDIIPYYTIKLNDNTEKQTILKYLSL